MLTFSVISSSTIRFCFGTRPVLVPEETRRAPVSVIEFGPTDLSGDHMCSGNIAYSYSSATLHTHTNVSVKFTRFKRYQTNKKGWGVTYEGLKTMFSFVMPRDLS